MSDLTVVSQGLTSKSEEHTFKPFQEISQDRQNMFRMPTKAEIDAWIAARPGAVETKSIQLRIGFPEVELFKVPCYATMRREDCIEVLILDGSTHRMGFDEVV